MHLTIDSHQEKNNKPNNPNPPNLNLNIPTNYTQTYLKTSCL